MRRFIIDDMWEKLGRRSKQNLCFGLVDQTQIFLVIIIVVSFVFSGIDRFTLSNIPEVTYDQSRLHANGPCVLVLEFNSGTPPLSTIE